MKKRLTQNNIIISVLASLLTVLVMSLFYGLYMQNTMYEQVRSQTRLLKHMLEETPEDNFRILYDIEKENITQGRVTYIYHNGLVTYDSMYSISDVENYADRPEVQEALNDDTDEMGIARRLDAVTGRMTYYCAARVGQDSCIRIAITTSDAFLDIIAAVTPLICTSVLVVLWICFIVSGKTSETIVEDIENYDIEKNTGNIYDELSPFINKISRQKIIINNQIQSITEEKLKLQSIFENIKESIVVCDRNMVIVQTNPEAQEIFGIKGLGMPFDSMFEIEEITSAMKQAAKGKIVQDIFPYRNSWYQFVASPNYYSGESGAILIIIDITYQVERENQRRQFTDNVTHELKTPLTSILGYSQLISNNIAKEEDILDFARIIEDNAILLLGMIDNIIRISNMETGISFYKTQVDLSEIILNSVKLLQPVADKKKINIITHLQSVTVQADESQIHQLVHNLISNAIKYNRDGGRVHIALTIRDNMAVFEVEDTGIGIPAGDIDKIFERFYVVDKARNKNISSSGLGLAIVKHVVKNHSGTINVKSAVDKGTKFTVRLPLE